MLANDALELRIVEEINQQASSRLDSKSFSRACLNIFLGRHANGEIDDITLTLIRMAIKANPDVDNVPQMIAAYKEVFGMYVSEKMPDLMVWISKCSELSLPLPVVIACEKYLDKAKSLSRDFGPRFFGVKPVIIIGGSSLAFDTSDEQVLTIPVSDVYEALPHKTFETRAVMTALGANNGMMKIDDDVNFVGNESLKMADIHAAFDGVDYMGVGIQPTYFERAWHNGKCHGPVPPLYCKPYIEPFANGNLYFLSKKALDESMSFYLRYPGCLAGELYEDKAIGDLLHRLGFALQDRSLEPILGVSTVAPERLILS